MRDCLKKLTIVDDRYENIRWSELKGMTLSLEKTDWPPTLQQFNLYPNSDPLLCSQGYMENKTMDQLWKGWDAGVEFPERELSEVDFVRVCFCNPER